MKKVIITLITFAFFSFTVSAQLPAVGCVVAFPFSSSIYVQGANLMGATSAYVGGSTAVDVIGFSATSSSVAVGLKSPLLPGSYHVLLIFPTGAPLAYNFVVSDYSNVNSFSPSVISIGDTLTVNMNTPTYLGAYTIESNNCGTLSESVFSQGQSQLKFVIKNGCLNTGNIYLQHYPSGNCTTIQSSLTGLAFNGIPSINTVTPLTGKTGDTITITGNNLYTKNFPSTVSFGGVAASKIFSISNKLIRAIVGPGATGNVSVTNSYGGTGSYPGFIYVPLSYNVCPGGNIIFNSNLSGSAYQWQLNTGNGFSNINAGSNYSGVYTASLSINNIPSSFYGNQYRCIVNGDSSNTYTLKIVVTFTGATNQDWATASNWSCNVVPDALSDVIIESGVVNINADGYCRTIIVKPGATVNVSTNTTLHVMH
ncbi:MAG: IPT/TIG domain-containing protein [Bacteroidota bacterium]